ncbi:N-acetylmuramic acid 6-phosphate etherase [Paenibacillus sp. SYP-B3998]|uniref:N-acetylmuramic acid 6-phosphate etherase n=1 Tax=Paenibacillus sp. SYP-B3998 TaxID=2678564 RepID=A0A6G4A1Z4_9BACL|nr:N-acetylmuramic acid 6-phosphate etherase [Paenibacillus sp. SYP-B3998]NEW07849.1 N-acetylmuramic acid 6-phosphate etherase [Paenibacillus sp. SYP-B3998]
MHHLLNELTTEQPNLNTSTIDQLTSEQIVALINNEDRQVADVIQSILPQIAQAADYIVEAFGKGGRLFYVGAGSSGRIGILDASECPPTFGTDPTLVQGLIAGGERAIKDAVEGAEDNEELGAQDMNTHGVGKHDVVIGIAASGRTPYVLGAMKRSRELGATVIGLCNNHGTPMIALAQLMLEAVVGPEVILGSTRMKSGTAQKLILNMLSTTAMIRVGKVYQNLMVDLHPSNAKLIFRSKRIIGMATGASEEDVHTAYTAADGHVKTAIVMLLAKVSAKEARNMLTQSDGFVRQAIKLAADV